MKTYDIKESEFTEESLGLGPLSIIEPIESSSGNPDKEDITTDVSVNSSTAQDISIVNKNEGLSSWTQKEGAIDNIETISSKQSSAVGKKEEDFIYFCKQMSASVNIENDNASKTYSVTESLGLNKLKEISVVDTYETDKRPRGRFHKNNVQMKIDLPAPTLLTLDPNMKLDLRKIDPITCVVGIPEQRRMSPMAKPSSKRDIQEERCVKPLEDQVSYSVDLEYIND